MNLSDLTYLADTIGNLSGIPVRVYEGQKEVYRTFPVPLVRDPIALHLDRILALPGHVGYYMAEDFSYYGFVSCTDSGIPAESAPVEHRLVIGPSRHSPFTKQALHRLAFDLEIPPEDVDSFVSAMRAIVTMPLDSILQILCTTNFALNGEKLSLSDLQLSQDLQTGLDDRAIREHTARIEDIPEVQPPHNTYSTELLLCDLIRRGDAEGFAQFTENAPALRPGLTSADALRQMKNIFIATVTLASRSAIRGGMDAEEALSLSDSLIRQCERLFSPQDITNLQYFAVKSYVEAVARVRSLGPRGPLARKVTAYVRAHLSEPIRTEEAAAALYMSRSHLSEAFHRETGMTLSSFIDLIKIDEAKHLLAHSDRSIAMIASYLGYSNQSHFTRKFREVTGLTPGAYRKMQ